MIYESLKVMGIYVERLLSSERLLEEVENPQVELVE